MEPNLRADELPPKSVAESWIWYVLNPQIDYCAFELSLLSRSLTYRGGVQGFERLVPLRDALLPAGKTVFDDMQGERADYDRLVREHDEALKVLLEAAKALFRSLISSPEFAAAIDQALRALRTSGKASVQEPASLQEEPTWLGYEAEHVVNDVAATLGTDHTDYRLWNNNRDALVAIATPELVLARNEARQSFSEAVRETREGLIKLRRYLSRTLDIPLVPTR